MQKILKIPALCVKHQLILWYCECESLDPKIMHLSLSINHRKILPRVPSKSRALKNQLSQTIQEGYLICPLSSQFLPLWSCSSLQFGMRLQMQQGETGERRKQISQHETCNVWVLDPQATLMSSHCADIKAVNRFPFMLEEAVALVVESCTACLGWRKQWISWLFFQIN